MKHFQEVTTDKIVLMGRKTYESIPEKFKPLPNRTNMILTRNLSFKAPGCTVVSKDYDVVLETSISPDVYIIGGAEIYKRFFQFTEELLVTHVHALIPETDTFFPKILPTEWQSEFVMRHEADDKNEFCFSVIRYKRIRK
jgi:dihydrofolate reductase